jgi:hypothetical protein
MMIEPQETMLDLLQKLNNATDSMLNQVIILNDKLEFASRLQVIDQPVNRERKPTGCALCELGIPLTKIRP